MQLVFKYAEKKKYRTYTILMNLVEKLIKNGF